MSDILTFASSETHALLTLTPARQIVFHAGSNTEVLRLDEQGMVYKGQRIEDAGEAYRAFMEVMGQMKAEL